MLNTILVALDGSELADRVMQMLEQLSLGKNTKIILCHVFAADKTELDIPADRPHPESHALAYINLEKQLETYQEKLAFPTEIELVTGEPAEEIIRLANIHKADLILIGNRGLVGMNRIVQGSVSSQVMEEAHCSVLVVKPH